MNWNSIVQWLTNRWSEPESRAAVAGALGTLFGWSQGAVPTNILYTALIGAAIMFVLPSTQSQAFLDAVTKAAKGPAVKSLLAFAIVAPLTFLCACAAFNTQVVDPLITDLSKINNTAITDLQTAQTVAQAATPPDTDGYNCAAAAITVAGQVNQVLTAANVSNAGVLTAAELASLFQPGSAQYNAAKQTLTSGCAAKAQDVLGAAGVLAAGGVVGAIAAGQVLPVLAAAS